MLLQFALAAALIMGVELAEWGFISNVNHQQGKAGYEGQPGHQSGGGQQGYEGQPGNQGGGNNNNGNGGNGNGLKGYEGQPGNQGG